MGCLLATPIKITHAVHEASVGSRITLVKMQILLVLLFLSCFRSSCTQSICVDHSYFNYECSQLARYCRVNRAIGIRTSCPVTCGLCQKDQPNPPGPSTPDRDFGRGIIRFMPADLEDHSLPGAAIRPPERPPTPAPVLETTTRSLPPEVIMLDPKATTPALVSEAPSSKISRALDCLQDLSFCPCRRNHATFNTSSEQQAQ